MDLLLVVPEGGLPWSYVVGKFEERLFAACGLICVHALINSGAARIFRHIIGPTCTLCVCLSFSFPWQSVIVVGKK